MINSNDMGYDIKDGSLKHFTTSYNLRANQKLMSKSIAFYHQEISKIKEVDREISFVYLKNLIENSYAYQTRNIGGKFNFRVKVLKNKLQDGYTRLSRGTSNMFSKLFGNAVGLVSLRKGKLFDDNKTLVDVRKNIKAGDILLEKTPFRLTDLLIPGHWGHAAIYIGTEDELKELGIWEHPLVKKYHQQIRNNQLVVEALRKGVAMHHMKDFLNVDDFAVLRDKNEHKDEVVKRIILTLRQVGKAYDFNFDIETSDNIVCSELIYITFTHIDWKTEKLAGRHTISPDNIALNTVSEDGVLEIVTLIHNGKVVLGEKKKFMKILLGV